MSLREFLQLRGCLSHHQARHEPLGKLKVSSTGEFSMTKKQKLAMTAGLVLGTFLGTAVSFAAPNAPKAEKPSTSWWDSPYAKEFYPGATGG
jgi:hypothetical protein